VTITQSTLCEGSEEKTESDQTTLDKGPLIMTFIIHKAMVEG